MFGFGDLEYGQEQERELELQAFSELLAEANDLGVDTGYSLEVVQTMDVNQLRAVRVIVEEAIAEAEINAAATLRPCPAGYAWRHEGEGFRCEGGSHYCTRDEIRQYMRSN